MRDISAEESVDDFGELRGAGEVLGSTRLNDQERQLGDDRNGRAGSAKVSGNIRHDGHGRALEFDDRRGSCWGHGQRDRHAADPQGHDGIDRRIEDPQSLDGTDRRVEDPQGLDGEFPGRLRPRRGGDGIGLGNMGGAEFSISTPPPRPPNGISDDAAARGNGISEYEGCEGRVDAIEGVTIDIKNATTEMNDEIRGGLRRINDRLDEVEEKSITQRTQCATAIE